MKKIVIVYHAFLYGDHYMDLITEQLRSIILAKHTGEGLEGNLFHACSKLYVGVIDYPKKKPGNGVEWLSKFLSFTGSKQESTKGKDKIELVVYNDNLHEARTMMWIRDYAKANPGDYILYFHTKGITKNTQPSTDWRKYMEYFVLENWKDCVQKLDEGYDCCGVMWNKDTPIGYHPHFSGTFWWANTNYINTLDHSYLFNENREDREFWIGTNPKAKVFEFHNSNYNTKERLLAGQGHYDVPYPEDKYMYKSDIIDFSQPYLLSSTDMTLHVICTVFQRIIPLRILVDSFILQTNPNWRLYIIHDGPAPKEMKEHMERYKHDTRISFTDTPEVVGNYGHPRKNELLRKLTFNHRDWVLMTNDDNYYVPRFVEFMSHAALVRGGKHGIVYCDTVHSYMNYDVLVSEIKQNYIDMGSFIVRLDVAKKIGFTNTFHAADGKYAEDCLAYCRRLRLKEYHIRKPLFIHN